MYAPKFIARLILLLALSAPSIAFAQNVEMRTGVHADYSRLVIDWPRKTASTVKKSNQTLTIAFDNAANPSTANIDITKTQNIKGVNVTNTNPLTVTLNMSGDNRYRSFYAGSRFVLDVYNLPGAQPPKIAQAPKPEPKPEAKPAPLPEAAKEAPKETPKPLNEVVKQAKAAIVEPVEVQTLDEQKNPPEPDFAELENPGLGTANLIALSSSRTFGLSVFERDDRIYIVNDDPDLLLNPKISGPDSKYLRPIESTEMDDAKIFTAQSILGTSIRTQGGGLLWKIIVSDAKLKDAPVKPQRINVSKDEIHGGKLLFPFIEASKLIEIPDPITGRMIKIVTSKSSKDFTGDRLSFPEFDILSSAAGMAILPRVDDLIIDIKSTGVEISRPNGLAILPQDLVETESLVEQVALNPDGTNKKRIFDFKNWQLGGLEAVRENQNILLASAAQMPDGERDAALMTLAKMYLANAMGAESLGFLEMIQNYTPEIANTPEFRAIRGAAKVLDYKAEDAFNDMAIKELDEFEEIGLWKAVALADIGDWQQAIERLPKNVSLFYEYPVGLINRIAPTAAEVALRAGNTDLADQILTLIEDNIKTLNEQQQAAVNYLKGEKYRQLKQKEYTKEYWEPLVTGSDDLYRAKAGLALARYEIDEGDIKPKDAIDTLERLRYSWRGDELEAQIGYWLGRTYFEAGEYVKGLNLMRESATVAAGTRLGTRITNEMSDMLTKLYMDDSFNTVSPLDAVALYEQFTEIIPGGDAGDKIVERLADRLTAADLLGRASNLLGYQLKHRLSGIDAYKVAVKLAAIYLLDSNPEEALKTLDTAQSEYDALPENLQTTDKIQDMTLLRARALSRSGRPDLGIEMLENLNKK